MHPHPVADALAKQVKALHAAGVLTFHCEAAPLTEAGKAAQEEAQHERIAFAADELTKQSFRDSLTIVALAQIILDAEADAADVPHRQFMQYPLAERQSVQDDATISLRIRRAEWRRLAQRAVTAAIEAGLQDMASRQLGPGQIHALARYLTGPAITAALEVYSGRMRVTPSEFAAALLDVERA